MDKTFLEVGKKDIHVNKAMWVQFQQGTETFIDPKAILRGTEPVIALTNMLLYCCELYNSFLKFLLVAISRWQGFNS